MPKRSPGAPRNRRARAASNGSENPSHGTPPAFAALRRYPGPKLSITAGEEQPFDLHKLERGVPHRHIAGTSHWPHLDQPDEFNRMLEEFLAQAR